MKIGLSNWFCNCNLVRFLCILFWVQTLWAGKIEHQRTHHSYSLVQITGTKIPYLDLPKEKRKSVLEKSSGVLYRKSIFSRDELAVIQKEVSTCMSELQEECSSSIAQKRSVATLSTNGEAVNILKYGSLHRLIERVTGKTCELATKVPVEIRVYERPGAGMAWHVDDVLYDPPQVEIVLTLENNSDCKTMWISGTGDNTESANRLKKSFTLNFSLKF